MYAMAFITDFTTAHITFADHLTDIISHLQSMRILLLYAVLHTITIGTGSITS